MNHSNAYIDFKQQLKATGKQKLDGYYPDLFDCIYENERKEIEEDIWHCFVRKNDTGLAIFMPYLKYYDGIEALRKKLSVFPFPSSGSADIAFALFDATGEKEYLNVIMDNYSAVDLNTPIVVGLAGLAKNPLVYPLLEEIYIHDENETNRIQAITGVLWKHGKLNDLHDTAEFIQKLDLIRSFDLDSAESRSDRMKKFHTTDVE